jgi:hypothetical protein
MAREEGFFDDLARGLADGSLTRGRALRLLGAALVGGALASLPGVALADDDDCRGFGRRCRRDRQCFSKNCVRRGDDKVCGCPEGKTRCGGRCVTNCTGGGTLNPQTCECGCPGGQVECNGSCVSNSCSEGQIFDPSICACVAQCLPNQRSCTADTQCRSGICTIPFGASSPFCFSCRGFGGACAANQTCCTGTCENGTCCGSEGQGCGVDADCCSGATCQGGLCVS